MPLKLSIGQTRKVSENYNSRGFSVHIEAELPANAVDDADTIASSANHLFQLCDDLLAEQVRSAQNGDGSPPQSQSGRTLPKPPTHAPNSRAGDHTNGSSSPARPPAPRNGNNGHANGRPITAAQSKAITNMARRLNRDPDVLVDGEYGLRSMSELSVSQASQIIDQLKQEIEAGEPVGASR